MKVSIYPLIIFYESIFCKQYIFCNCYCNYCYCYYYCYCN